MVIGIIFLVLFLLASFFMVIGSGIVIDWIVAFLDTIGIDATPEALNMVPYLLAIPFLVFALLGLAIILLTQRTARVARHLRATKKEAGKIANSDFSTYTKDELIELFEENDIKYKKNMSKPKLVEIAEKNFE